MKHTINDSTLTLSIEEDIISTTVKACLTEAQSLIEESADISEIHIDLTEVNTVDSQGLNLLVGIYQECRSRDWSFKVVGASASLKRLFQFVKLSERFGIDS